MALRVYGNRLLKTLPGLETRPTPSRVREAVFTLWRDRLDGCRWLDLCAGAGAMGAEALGRGAGLVVGVERSKAACQVIEHNWNRIAKDDRPTHIFKGDVRRLLRPVAKQFGVFDCIYFDPPYASELYQPVLSQIAQLGLLATDGQLIAEHTTSHHLPEHIGGLITSDRRTYGQTAVTLYQLECPSDTSESEE